ncbi:MBL fold metallo-hydrolase [Halobellus captivus]|uniref:MBL fold metallo-hydrolase n=1 Tax=Halobellus captivus TaxID=2592614 RepID=UPI00119ECF5B|nr:MBL fold metallo-hydrolase [Halobellus captivus]
MFEEIVPGVYDITTQTRPSGGRFRVYLFDGDTPTLIDTGFEETTDRVVDAVEEIGIRPERLVITHGDHDHIDGFDALVDALGVETWVPEQTDASQFENDPDHRYTEGTSIGEFAPVHVPGHRADNHALVNERTGVAVMGDAVFGSDRRGLPAGYLVPPPAAFSEDVHEAEMNLDKLLDYEFDAALVFHGSSVTRNASETLASYVDFPGRS